MKRYTWLWFALLALCAGLTQAGGLEKKHIVDTAYVAEAMKRGALLWDVRSADDFRKGHIPGALNIGHIGQVLRYEHDEDYLPVPQIEKILGDAGIDPSREIVVYGEKADPFAYFGWFTVGYFGGNNVTVYHGGIDDWRSARKEVSNDPVKPQALALKLKARPELVIGTDEIVSKLNSSVQIIDARTPREFSGEDIRAIRGGHIPGAINIPFQNNWIDPDARAKLAKREVAAKDGMNLKPLDQLKATYAKLDPEKETIVYCQSGVRAAESLAVLKELGFRNLKLYDSSWLGYSNALSTPVEAVTFFNVGQMVGKMDAMQRRLDGMDRLLHEMMKAMKQTP